ncbi:MULTISPECIES: CHAD domain-containing protein [Thiorhodovibrio]|uniref:CHAD domain-containing protein n=1 Tax=Thiorhodovibrio TaxID=61593 RepID=UPI0019119406|nr:MULTISPECIES: CHAD domain-containing protein [Thiorhodovibrio]MBK5968314.1 hypothetical protein [Thiorhodovibrio winogradskyi]WPL13237.1 hypothetical protein Thiosp_03031 [Thiorhodovibrio litoralis]
MAAKTKQSPPLTAEMPVAAAIRVILRHNFEAMLAHEALARAGTDIEGVHQMRVSLRRMRSALSLFRKLLDPEQARAWREQMRELAGQLGRARDLDVFIDEGLADTAGKLPLPGEAALRELAARRRADVYAEEVQALLDSDSYRRFREEFPLWLEQGGEPGMDQPDRRARKLARPIIGSARKLLDKQARRVLDAGSAADRHDAPAMHQLRIECKKLRYAAEFFRPLFSDMGQFIACMKGIQDVLGVMNDLALTQSLLDDLLARDPDNRELRTYAGALIGWRSYHFHQLLEDFDSRWEALVSARRPWWD